MRIAILGTGMLAEALGSRWVRTGHDITVSGRSSEKARAVAVRLRSTGAADREGTGIGARAGQVRAATPSEAVTDADAVLLAVSWAGVAQVLRSAGAADGALAGTTLIDPTNAVQHGVGVLSTPPETSAAELIAALAPKAHVVKAFHLQPAHLWRAPTGPGLRVAICGDDPESLRVTRTLIRDAGAEPAVLGPLSRARQLEEVAGFAIGLAFQGIDPRAALPPRVE
ncbi:NAD(P)-binding domain-containing protein [Nocardia otitidiscaviarum]|uniref:NADPH-dependent F420 reductase n=1 Tax=Nocardia otitidiscaviarum TaxID=1823 RepID=UPI001894AC6B|nr:NAD(P)-binding domain-containing protein [Nocardia otitidiscaviarum]MBF6237422.1 NAD(P)-binding domain-containing protein [Nocardia otitidiscaviarum]